MSNTNIQSAFSEEVGAAMPSDFSIRARLHYAKALRKHPRFADKLHDFACQDDAEDALAHIRDKIDYASRWPKCLYAYDLLRCEILEAWTAPNAKKQIDELYDAVAVLMRMIAVVEGKQKLGAKEERE